MVEGKGDVPLTGGEWWSEADRSAPTFWFIDAPDDCDTLGKCFVSNRLVLSFLLYSAPWKLSGTVVRDTAITRFLCW